MELPGRTQQISSNQKWHPKLKLSCQL